MKKLPIGPLTPKIYNRKNPTTVGGNTIGSVKIPSSIIFAVSFFILKRPQATIKPTKKVIKIDTLAVFIEMKIGDQSVMSKLLKKLVIQMNKLILNYYFLTLLVIQMNNI